ncbi:hypothetical protein B0H19DRAFT_1261241 [Mycena capillaripes]|nr:hypothetical protein B0H19DRAFT_1261241 [Mycena capillaripes]
MEELGLQPAAGEGIKITSNLTLHLHDIENALSNLVSSVFWIAGHIHPPPLTLKYGFANNSVGSMSLNIQKPPILEANITTLSQFAPAARLDLSPWAVSLGLGASLILLVLAILFCGTANIRVSRTSLNSMGLLQTLWIFQHHPELSGILEHVEDPTDYRLRAAGLVKVRLLDAEDDEFRRASK